MKEFCKNLQILVSSPLEFYYSKFMKKREKEWEKNGEMNFWLKLEILNSKKGIFRDGFKNCSRCDRGLGKKKTIVLVCVGGERERERERE